MCPAAGCLLRSVPAGVPSMQPMEEQCQQKQIQGVKFPKSGVWAQQMRAGGKVPMAIWMGVFMIQIPGPYYDGHTKPY